MIRGGTIQAPRVSMHHVKSITIQQCITAYKYYKLEHFTSIYSYTNTYFAVSIHTLKHYALMRHSIGPSLIMILEHAYILYSGLFLKVCIFGYFEEALFCKNKFLGSFFKNTFSQALMS